LAGRSDTRRASELRAALVGELEQRGAIRSRAVREAFFAVPRDLFVPERSLEEVYLDDAIPTKFGVTGMPMSSSSQPAIMAEMLERLALEPGMRVLEIGAGTGYNAALVSELVGPDGRVDTIDIDRDTARRARRALREGGFPVKVSVADGREGFPARAPYDRIIVTASSGTVPRAWFEQLGDGGVVVAPLRLREAAGAHVVASLEKWGHGFRSRSLVGGGFMPLRNADDPGLPPSMRSIVVSDLTGDRPRKLQQISGAAVAGLSDPAKRRLVAISLEPARTRRFGARADARALISYLSLALPASRAVTTVPLWGLGVLTRDGRSLAYVVGGPQTKTLSTVQSHGDRRAEDELLDVLADWKAAGRPNLDDLSISVRYEGDRPIVSWRHASRTALRSTEGGRA
jgi:protein-L-isoaspartate(D-aspartate) O-methyltransferase